MSDWIIACILFYFRKVIFFIIGICFLVYALKHYFWWIVVWVTVIAAGFGICFFIDYLRGRPLPSKSSSSNMDTSKKNGSICQQRDSR
jgi:hypothetical protein